MNVLPLLKRRLLCANGWHGKVLWRKKLRGDAQTVASRSTGAEIFVASGMMDLATFIGCCHRCGRPLQWASFNPDLPRPAGSPK